MVGSPSQHQRIDFTNVITLCAGEEQKEFLVHKSVITTSSSGFLRKALTNDWREAREKSIRLPEAQSDTLEAYIHWMYTGCIVLKQADVEADSLQLVKLYILSDFLCDDVSCAAVAERMVDNAFESISLLPGPRAVKLAWEATSTDSPLRSVIKELWLHQRIDRAVGWVRSDDRYPRQFILDLLEDFVSSKPDVCREQFLGKSAAKAKETCKGYINGARSKRNA